MASKCPRSRKMWAIRHTPFPRATSGKRTGAASMKVCYLGGYFYRKHDALQFFDNDRYIGASKAACYCCSLYIREHPGGFVEPATHQKNYLNWLPPTSTPEVQEPNSETAIHERMMLNSMVKAIRKRTIEQLKAQTGGERRRHHFDSITWETLPSQRSTARHDEHGLVNLPLGSLPSSPELAAAALTRIPFCWPPSSP
jgi:OTT_1508-like deaminase